MIIPCPRCNSPLNFDQTFAGQVVACPYCGQQINVNFPTSTQTSYRSSSPSRKRSTSGTIITIALLSFAALFVTCCGGMFVLNQKSQSSVFETAPQDFQCPPGLNAEETKAMVIDAVQRELGPLVSLTLDEQMSIAIVSAENIYVASGRATAKKGGYSEMPIRYRAVITRYEPSEPWYMGKVTIEKL